MPGHQFWPDDHSLTDAFRFPSLPDSQALTNLYLLALALARKSCLASFDRRIDPSLLPNGDKAYYLITS